MPHFTFGKLIAKSALRKPATRLYPFERRAPLGATRGHVKFVADSCSYCTICAKKCPTNAITIDRKLKHWQLDSRKCILCSACVDKCPKSCLTMETASMPPMTAAQWQDIEERIVPPKPAPALAVAVPTLPAVSGSAPAVAV